MFIDTFDLIVIFAFGLGLGFVLGIWVFQFNQDVPGASECDSGPSDIGEHVPNGKKPIEPDPKPWEADK